MRFLLRQLSLSYARHHRGKTLLTLLGVVVGVATFTSIRTARATLVSGLKGTVDRMAGKAHLQVFADGGVPEEMLERLYDHEGILAVAPAIEQIVLPEQTELGSLLVLGVDLLGDREMREYGFDGEDQDIDDPLLFLAQADSIAMARDLARRAGLEAGDRFRFNTPRGVKDVVVRGLLEPKGVAEAFGGNLIVMDVYAAQDLFGRGRRFDRIEVRLEEGVDLARGQELVLTAVGPGYRIETPERRGAAMEKLIANFTIGFTMSSVMALGIGTFLIYNSFSVAVQRRRRDIGTLRALGATPRQVQALFLLESLCLGVAGAVLGIGVGVALAKASLGVMGETVAQVYGLHNRASVELDLEVVLQSLALGIVASLVGGWSPARAASRVKPTEALAKGVHGARMAPASGLRLALGFGGFALAIVVAKWQAVPGLVRFALPLGLGSVATIVLAGPLARLLLEALAPLLARVTPVAGRLAADSLLSNPRRTSGTVVAMTLSLAFVIGMGGYLSSVKHTLSRWMDQTLTSDLYVRSSPNLTHHDYRFDPAVKDELLGLPGVERVESFRGMRVPYRGAEIMVMSIDIDPLLDRSVFDFTAGDTETMREGLARQRKVAISDNLSRLHGLGVGDDLVLDTPTGTARLPVAVVVNDFSSDQGSLYLDRALFVEIFADDRVDTFDITIGEGVDPHTVRDAVRKQIGGRMPALISTRREFTAEIGKAIDAFHALTQVTVLLALVVAFLGIVTSLLITVAERQREIGILKALGALGSQIRTSVVFEALAVALVALAIAIPIGALDKRFMETTVAEVFTGWSMPSTWKLTVLFQLLVALPIVSAIAAWVPARAAAETKVTEAIEYE